VADDASALEMLRRITALVAQHNLAELSLEGDGLTLSVKGLSEAAPPPPAPLAVVQMHPQALPSAHAPLVSQTPVLTPQAAPPAPPPAPASPSKGRSRIAQESPMVGVFYRSPSPDDPPFVNVGDLVSLGQTIGLIEAMKVYSELPSEVAGRVVEIAVQSGKLVQQGQPIFYVEPV